MAIQIEHPLIDFIAFAMYLQILGIVYLGNVPAVLLSVLVDLMLLFLTLALANGETIM